MAYNPALLDASLKSLVSASFNHFPGGINTYGLAGAFASGRLNTVFGGHIFFIDYGSIPQTDGAGNINGTFHPVDFVVQASAGRQYLEHWKYGATLKLIHSGYLQYTSSALAVDFGVLYFDSVNQFSTAVVAKNMGTQLKTYAGQTEDLPFDFEIGMTKKLSKAPFGFSITAHHLHQFNIHYNDVDFLTANGYQADNQFLTKLLNHFIVAVHIYIGSNLETTFGYNHLRRTELNSGSSGNGLNGFSAGFRLKFQKIQILYARSNYEGNISYNQFGLALWMGKLFGLGE